MSKDEFRISKALAETYERTTLRGGEVLLTLVGASIGRAAVVPAKMNGYNVSRAIAVIPVLDDLAEWVHLFLESPLGQKYLFGHSAGAAQQVVNLQDIKSLRIPLPPAGERSRLLAELRNALHALEVMSEETGRADEQARNIITMVFRDAFSGALVARSPNSAEGLLTTIEEQRTKLLSQPKRRAATPQKGPSMNDQLSFDDASPDHLGAILSRRRGTMSAGDLWRESGLSIDDFYKQLKREMGKTVKEEGANRRLKAVS